MDGNVVFGGGSQEQPVKREVSPVQNTPSSPPSSTAPAATPPPPQSPPPPIPRTGGMLPTLLKIVIPILIVIVLIVLAVVFVLPRLGSNGANGGNVTITYWGLWEPDGIMTSIIDDFESQNPSITVEYEQRDIRQYKETLLTRINSGEGPDVFRFHNSWTKTMTDTLAPIPSSVITPEEFEEQFFLVVQEDMIVDSGLYGIPRHMDTIALFVNDGILEDFGIAVPTTWEDFTRVAALVSVVDDSGALHTSGAAFGTYDNITHAPDIISVLLAQNRINLQDPTSSPEQNYAEALRFYTDFASGRDNIPRVWDQNREVSLDAFAAGNVAMYFGYSWDIFAILEKNPELDFSTHPVPALTTPITIASYWAEGVSSKSQHQREAMLFLQFLTSKETQQKIYSETSKTRLFGELPARRDLAAELSDNALAYPFVSQAETAVSSYFVSDTFDESFNGQLNSYLANAVRSMLGNTSAESAVATMMEGISQVLSRYGI